MLSKHRASRTLTSASFRITSTTDIARIVRQTPPRTPGKALASGLQWAVSAVFSRASASWLFRVSDQLSLRGGLWLLPLVGRQGRLWAVLPAALWARLLGQAYPNATRSEERRVGKEWRG